MHGPTRLIESNLTPSPVSMRERQKELNGGLELAIPASSQEVIARLLTLGATLNSRSCLTFLARQEPAILQLLLDFGWDVNSTETNFATVHLAVEYEISLGWLLEYGADPSVSSERRTIGSCLQRATALDYASKRSDATAVNLLLSHGAKLDADAIYYAIGLRYQKNGTATLQALIDHGADVNYVSEKYFTPLHHVVLRGQLDKLTLLLERGADPSIKALRRQISALEFAKEKGYTDMAEMMEAASR
ncbi:hypothetical protein HBI25_160080 [Parastagonospora nodorum]|nr:hypothetical protein HBH51_154680 [Parastagonospora nodorum]KAH4062981.1 hypothetical protein HBH50_197850 [Parastagonospora nodorum]KAH4083415.1 hypothetical protein HBH48_174750 [Parastagonospora nodorum]KAH4161291.1 hypothetical protein HBH43_170390 [Parastagonospora nodorum]KAH4202913.1 hypothetical protein HBI95_159680 [Parastagonospora nodorum]